MLPAHTGYAAHLFPCGIAGPRGNSGSEAVCQTAQLCPPAKALGTCIHAPASRQREGNQLQTLLPSGSVSDKTLPPGNPHSLALADPKPWPGQGYLAGSAALPYILRLDLRWLRLLATVRCWGGQLQVGEARCHPSLMCKLSGHCPPPTSLCSITCHSPSTCVDGCPLFPTKILQLVLGTAQIPPPPGSPPAGFSP